jgi:hypothetical protein
MAVSFNRADCKTQMKILISFEIEDRRMPNAALLQARDPGPERNA